MVIGMKTTLNLNEQLIRGAKAEAAQRGMTLTEFVDDALRLALDREIKPYRFEMSVVEGDLGDIPFNDREKLYDWFDRNP